MALWCGLVVWIESICIVCQSFCLVPIAILVPIGQWAGWYKQFFLNFPGCCILKVEGKRCMLQCLHTVTFCPFFLTVQWFFWFDFADGDGDCNKDDDDDYGRLKAWQPQWEDWALPISSARTSEKKLGKKTTKPLFHLTILTLTSISLETKPDRLQPHAMQVQVLSKQFHSWLCRSLTFILIQVILLFSSWEQICIKHFQVLDITDCLLWGSLQVVASGWRALILRVEVPANTLQIKQNTLHWGVSWCHYFRKKWSVGFFCYFDIFLQTCISLYCCSIAMLSW